MMQKKKEESGKRRRRRDVDLISDSDDLIADIISQMRQAAEVSKDFLMFIVNYIKLICTYL